MTARFNPPPGWPPAPQGWTPPPGWSPDPSWPAPPPGWQLWVEDSAPQAPGQAPAAPAPTAPLPTTPDDVARFAKPGPGEQTPVGAPFQNGAPAAPGAPGQAPAPWAQAGQPGGQPGGADWSAVPAEPAAKKSPQWLIPVGIAVVAIGAIVGVLFLTGVLGGSDDKPSADPTTTSASPAPSDDPSDDPTTDPSDEPTVDPSEDPSDDPSDTPTTPSGTDNGSRSNPLAPGDVATIAHWTVSLGATNTDAWPAIEASLDSDYARTAYKPQDGYSYLMAPLSVTYVGEGSSMIYDLTWVYVSSAGVTYRDVCTYQLPDGLESGQELYTDGSKTGNVCISVPTEDVAGGVWRIDARDDDFNTQETYYALS